MSKPNFHPLASHPVDPTKSFASLYQKAQPVTKPAGQATGDAQGCNSSELEAKKEAVEAQPSNSGNLNPTELYSSKSTALDGDKIMPACPRPLPVGRNPHYPAGYTNKDGSGMYGATRIEPAQQGTSPTASSEDIVIGIEVHPGRAGPVGEFNVAGTPGRRGGGEEQGIGFGLALRLFRNKHPHIFMLILVFTVLSFVAVIILAISIGLSDRFVKDVKE